MNFLKKLGCAAAITFAMAGTASAAPVLNDWVFNPTGGGFAGGQVINEYLDVNGNAFIQINPTTGNNFSFRENAVFNILQADSNGRPFRTNISATFEAFGTGTFGEGFTFTGGTIRMYQNPVDGQYGTTEGYYGANLGNEIAVFTIVPGGGGMVDSSGNPISNGQVSVFAKADVGALDAGYFFRSNGQDLSEESILSFAFTNANNVGSPTPTLIDEVACQFAGYTGPGCDGTPFTTGEGGPRFFVSNNGQFKLAEVPEPGSLALFGIAMLGAGVISRKRAKKA